MAKTKVKGKFATGADVATVHQISHARQQWLDREISKATADVVVFFTPLTTKTGRHPSPNSKKSRTTSKSAAAKRSGKIVRLRTKKK